MTFQIKIVMNLHNKVAAQAKNALGIQTARQFDNINTLDSHKLYIF